MEMLVTIPNIEFAKGVPPALEQDSYLDVNKRNLIVLTIRCLMPAKTSESLSFLLEVLIIAISVLYSA